jgi:hypothetical protein
MGWMKHDTSLSPSYLKQNTKVPPDEILNQNQNMQPQNELITLSRYDDKGGFLVAEQGKGKVETTLSMK